MAKLLKWLCVPVAFTLLRFLVLLPLWLPEQTPSSAAAMPWPDPGTVRWLWSSSLLHGSVLLILTQMSLKLLPSIRWPHALYVALGAVAAEASAQMLFLAIHGPRATNGAFLLVAVPAYIATLLISAALLRRAGSTSKPAGETTG